MRILIVEDDNLKKGKILDVISQISEVEVTEATNILKAKEQLIITQFDLMVLDINLPIQEGDRDTLENGGYILYREIKESEMYKKPNHIIILTSFSDLKDKYQEEIESSSFRIVQYEPLGLNWRRELESRIKYIQQYNKDKTRHLANTYDFFAAIVTAVDIEFDTCKEIIENTSLIKKEFDGTYYTIGNIRGDISKKVVLLKQHQMGLTASSVASFKVIYNFKPKYIVMSGIAGGVKDSVELGDVVLATEVVEFTSGKIQNESSLDKMFKPEPKYLSISSDIKEIINKDFGSDIDRIVAQNNYENRELNGFNVVVGPVVSGPFVLQNDFVIKKFILPYNRKVKAIDMEAYGVLYASENAFTPKPKAIICKAISDFADEQKNDDYQKNAALNSAYFVESLIKNHLA